MEDYLNTVAVAALTGGWTPFNLAVLNPPFTLPSRPEAWAEHVLAVTDDPHLLNAPGSALGAVVVPHIALGGSSKRARQVRDRLGHPVCDTPTGRLACRRGEIQPCERGAFTPVGAQVSTALLWIRDIHSDRHFDLDPQPSASGPRARRGR